MATKPGMTPQGHPERADGGHEGTDAHAGGIFAAVIGLLVGIVVIHFVLSGLLAHLNKKPSGKDLWQPRQAATVAAWRPNLPRLQVSPPADLDQFRVREDAELKSYGWVNRSNGIIRVPIERAMELMLQKGLPREPGKNGPSNLQLQQQRPQFTAPESKEER